MTIPRAFKFLFDHLLLFLRWPMRIMLGGKSACLCWKGLLSLVPTGPKLLQSSLHIFLLLTLILFAIHFIDTLLCRIVVGAT